MQMLAAQQEAARRVELPHLSFKPVGSLVLKNMSHPVDVLSVTWPKG